MADGASRAGPVVGGDVRRAFALQRQVDGHAGDAGVDERRDRRMPFVDAHHDDAVEAVLPGRTQVHVHAGGAASDRQDHEMEAAGGQRLLDPDEQVEQEGRPAALVRVAGVPDQADHVRAAPDQCAGRLIGRIAELLGEFQDAAPGLRAHFRTVVERS